MSHPTPVHDPLSVPLDPRLFGRAGEGYIWCVPIDRHAAATLLRHLHILASGPWDGHIKPGGVVLHGPVTAVIWHVNAEAIGRLFAADLIDPDWVI